MSTQTLAMRAIMAPLLCLALTACQSTGGLDAQAELSPTNGGSPAGVGGSVTAPGSDKARTRPDTGKGLSEDARSELERLGFKPLRPANNAPEKARGGSGLANTELLDGDGASADGTKESPHPNVGAEGDGAAPSDGSERLMDGNMAAPTSDATAGSDEPSNATTLPGFGDPTQANPLGVDSPGAASIITTSRCDDIITGFVGRAARRGVRLLPRRLPIGLVMLPDREGQETFLILFTAGFMSQEEVESHGGEYFGCVKDGSYYEGLSRL